MPNKEYWQTRMINNMLASERSVVEYEQRLSEAYSLALREIEKELSLFYQKYARENKISYAEARKRLTPKERKDFNTTLKEWYRMAKEGGMSWDYVERLQELGKRVYVSRLESLEASINHQVETLKNTQFKQMTNLVTDNYMSNYYATYFVVAQGSNNAVSFATIDNKAIQIAVKQKWEGRNYSDSIWSDKDRLIANIEKILPRSFSIGQSSTELGKLLAKEMNVSQNRGVALARTEVNYLCNQSSLEVYKAAGLEEYEYLATLDMRTSDICRGLDGFVGKVTQAKVGVNYPPMHVNCRSTTIPVIADDDPDGERIARDEDGNNIMVPRRMTQEQWINQYAPESDRPLLLAFKRKFVKD